MEQDIWLPDVLLIGSGGFRGFHYLGFITALEKSNHLVNVNTYIGVSIGSIISLLLLCGYSSQQIIEIGMDTSPFSLWSGITMAFEGKGLLDTNKLRSIIEPLVVAKLGSVPTLNELITKIGKSLITVSYNIDTRSTQFNDYTTSPNKSCIDAVLESSSIPLVFYCYNEDEGRKADGALGNPYPIRYIDNGIKRILGVFIKDMNDQISNSYIHSLVTSSIDQRIMSEIEVSSNRCRNVALKPLTKDTIGMTLNLDTKAKMIMSSYEQGISYIRDPINSCFRKQTMKYHYHDS